MWITYGITAGIVLGIHDVWMKLSVKHNNALTVVMWSTFFGALCWLPFMIFDDFGTALEVGPTSLKQQLYIAPKSLAMAASWIFAYESVKRLPVSIAGAVRASGPLWTLAGGMFFLSEYISQVQLMGLVLTVLSYYVFTIVGRREGVFTDGVLALLMMLAATLLAAGTTVYDKYLVEVVSLRPADIQAWSAQHRFMVVVAFLAVLPNRAANFSISRWTWAIPLLGTFWVIAEVIYFLAVAEPEAKVAYLAVFRRAALVVSFIVSAIWFGERFIAWKALMIFLLVFGIAIVVVG